MRGRMILGGLFALGLSTLAPNLAQAGRAPERRTETRAVTHETQRVEHVTRVERPVLRNVRETRDVHVTIDRDRYIPAPVIQTQYVAVPTADFDLSVSLGQVPASVIDAANRQSGGAPIAGIDYIRSGGSLFYDVHVASAYGQQTLRFGINGGYLG